MSPARVIPAADLPAEVAGPGSPVWWGMILLVAIETTVFATLISSFFYLQLMAPEWPPADVRPPDLLLPLVNTGVLLTSTASIYWATRGIKKGDQRRLKIGLGIGVVLETVFFVIKLMVSGGIRHGFTDHAYASIFWTISRLHTGHVLAAILMGSVAEILALRGYFTEQRRVGVDAVNIYFQFVAFIWLPVLLVLYLLPHWS
ncbi:MAG: cytochrome c oxidase subunit 3 [Gemmatimonadetes bacterium]|nr:cytochrome c oxidase subunit 3 [Gemmatimonadota bacterium]